MSLDKVAEQAVIESIVDQAIQHLQHPLYDTLMNFSDLELDQSDSDPVNEVRKGLSNDIQKEISHCLSQYSEWLTR